MFAHFDGGLKRLDPMGFDFELAKLIAENLDVRLAMVVPPSRDQLIPWLLEGRGDIIASRNQPRSSRDGVREMCC